MITFFLPVLNFMCHLETEMSVLWDKMIYLMNITSQLPAGLQKYIIPGPAYLPSHDL